MNPKWTRGWIVEEGNNASIISPNCPWSNFGKYVSAHFPRAGNASYFIGCLNCALSPLRYRSGCITFYRGVWLCIYQSMSEDNEIELRAHIRHLLLDYALTHLTTDYVVYTHSAVAEVRICGHAYSRLPLWTGITAASGYPGFCTNCGPNKSAIRVKHLQYTS